MNMEPLSDTGVRTLPQTELNLMLPPICLPTAPHKLDIELRTLSLTTADSREFSSKRISGKIPGTSNLAA